MNIAVGTLVIAGLLMLVSLVHPLAVRLKLPHSVLLAMIGTTIGLASSMLMRTPELRAVVEPLVSLPFRSATFMHIFLPALLFQASLTIDVRRIMEDAVPILLLATVAVFAATAAIGFSLAGLTQQSLTVCLLVGAIVATTDPAAVVAVFRDLGAPSRLTNLVEGESLLNDAAAITLFTILLGLLVSKADIDAADVGLILTTGLLGGIALGVLLARLVVLALPLVAEMPAAEVSLSLGLAYVAFITGEMIHVSGVVAVVAAGLTMGAVGRTRLSPASWSHLDGVWEQIAYWAGSMLFILASILIPKMLMQATLDDLALLPVVIAAALASRAFVLFVILPVFSAFGLSQRIGHRFKLVITWGGLRGAVTLALALAVIENRVLDPRTKSFVAVLATGFVLYTLLIQGTTLRPLLRGLKLDHLSPLYQALRQQVLALSLAEVRDAVRTAGREYGAATAVVEQVAGPYAARAEQVAGQDLDAALTERERLITGLVALADRERELVLAHHGLGTASPRIIEVLVRNAAQIAEAARSDGRNGYNRAAKTLLAHDGFTRITFHLHRWMGFDRPLTRQLADRFELMMVRKVVLDELTIFNERRMPPLLGGRIADLLADILAHRRNATAMALEALRLQYPEYAAAMERRSLRRYALRLELKHYRTLKEEGLIGDDLFNHLRRELRGAEREAAARPKLDLRLSTADMLDRLEPFTMLGEAERRRLAADFKTSFAMPGQTIIRRGDRSRSVYFISSGAVEVVFPRERFRLGRGDFFGEIALLEGGPRVADVVALGYCRLLVLAQADFERFLDQHPHAREAIEATARRRMPMELPLPAGALDDASSPGHAA